MGLTTILDKLSPISLDEMSSIRLMNRMDYKFIATSEQLEDLLIHVRDLYRAQEVDGNRLSPYHTIYLDTLEYTMYLAHHNGRAIREKIRVRTYVDSLLTFLEVKNKNNKGRTDKKRIKVDSYENMNQDTARTFLKESSWFTLDELRPVIENRFSRITLVNKELTERLTIDTCLCFHNFITGSDVTLPGLVVIELKRDGFAWSPISGVLHDMRIRTLGFSKYCMGSALTNETIKRNNFKQKIILINKLLKQ